MPGFQVQGLGDPAVSSRVEYYYSYTWSVPHIIGKDGTSLPLIMLKDATTPTFTANKENYIASSLEYKYAKSVTWEDIKLTWYDTVGLINVLKDWRRSVWTPEGGLKPASEYKRDTILECLLPTNNSPFGWKLLGSWPSQIRSGELTYTNSEVKLVEVTVTYDWAEECLGQCGVNTISVS